jgi:M6 family metalloprotease-like protein
MLVVVATLQVAGAAADDGPPARATDHPLLQPIDAQDWVDEVDTTWDDYVPVRPDGWTDGSVEASDEQYRGALVLLDFTDQPFLITQEPETHVFGNPQAGHVPVAQEDVAEYMTGWLIDPEHPANGGQTLHGYWMETSHGKIGIDIEAFGPYTLPGKLHEYGLAGYAPTSGTNSRCPAGDSCNKNIRTHGLPLWQADAGSDVLSEFDFVFYVTAGHTETSIWGPFGNMMFETPEDVPPEFGPPGAIDGPVYNAAGNEIPNWSPTRYVPWTSWQAAAAHWSNASTSGGVRSSTQGESSGQSVYQHEFSHLRGLPDNYNNPFADNVRNYSGYWDMMSRGTFNGPGGTHNRWQVPNQGGSGLGPHHMVRHKRALGVYDDGDLLVLQRDDLPDQGVAVARVQQRSLPFGQGGYLGINVAFGQTTANGQNLRTCAAQGFTGANSFWCHGNNNYHNYTLEVVKPVGNDSYIPGHGVLLALSRNTNSQPNVWVIDPNTDDIGMIDFYLADGTPVPVVRGDPRQLNDATFHAGTDSGSAYEEVDPYNRLHFYVVDTHTDSAGVLSYDLAVRHLDGAGAFERGVALGAAAKTGQEPGWLATCTFPLTNTGAAGAAPFDSDVYRLSATSSSDDWEVTLPNALAAVKAGETVDVGVHALRHPADDGDARTNVTLTATSETDPSRSASSTCAVHVRDTTPAGT